MADGLMPPIHPGEILTEEFLGPLRLSPERLARAIGVQPQLVDEIARGERAISSDIAVRLARYFGTSDRFWSNLQSRYDSE